MKQKDIFLESEGTAWLRRNRDKLGLRDPVTDMITSENLMPKRVLEVGCANGWRLAKLRDHFDCEVMGVEPSMEACIEAASLQVPVVQCSASSLAISGPFDLIIFGFCLYLTDPADWFKIATESDTLLAPGGHLIIHDFDVEDTHARRYEHRDGVMSYHFEFANLWLAHPLYEMIRRRHYHSHDEMVTIIRKNPLSTIEVRP